MSQVSMKFNQKNAKPGENVQMTLSAAPNSLCATSMVDRSVYLVGGVNLLQKETVEERLTQYDVSSSFMNDWRYCRDTSIMPPDYENPDTGVLFCIF